MEKRRPMAFVIGLALLGAALGQAGERAVPEKYRWNLGDLYPTSAAFDTARHTLPERFSRLESYRGKLGGSAATLKAALDEYFGTRKELNRIFSYASMRSDQDTRVPDALAGRQETQQLSTDLDTRSAWLAPEILALPAGTTARFLEKEAGLAPYRFFLEDLERQRPHTLSPSEEKLLAQAGSLSAAPTTFYEILTYADMPFPEVTLSDGQKVRLDQAAYTKYRALAKREDRKLVFQEFWKAYKAFERTLGVALDTQVRRDLYYARARKYPSSLASALSANNVPETVYKTLIAETNRALPTLHRAFKLRARLLGIADLAYYDIYPPLVPSLNLSFPIEEGERLVLDAVRPLGDAYGAAIKRGFESRWMDVYPQTGKRSGAYSDGAAYDVHPYVLLNYNDDYESVSTLAHEFGHAMHSYLANHAQPYPTADYPIFVAEVASTFNEALLLRRVLDQAKTDDERLYYLGSYLEGVRATFFRQAMFAEFELAIHEAVEKDEALTSERLSKMYGELLRRYHGHDGGVMKIDPAFEVEWAYIPHFYRDFYVYQYATSIAASALLAQDVLDAKPGALERYLGVLKAGGSRYPYDLLKQAGVDLATPAPYRALEARMNWVMDEIEKVEARKDAAKSKP